jgi:hypothetical protein
MSVEADVGRSGRQEAGRDRAVAGSSPGLSAEPADDRCLRLVEQHGEAETMGPEMPMRYAALVPCALCSILLSNKTFDAEVNFAR